MPKPASARYRPQLATLVKEPPDGEDWFHEIKYDGYRIGCLVNGGEVRLISRNGKDWTSRFGEIAEAARALKLRTALLDGEVAMLLPDGRTSFQALQNAFGGGARKGLVYFVFDLILGDGEDLAQETLEARKAALRELIGNDASGRIRYSEHVAGNGREMLHHACRLGLEGIVSKRRDQPYRPGRNEGWLKSKCTRRQEFVVGGFTDPEGSRVGIGALLVGYYEGGRLEFAGKVGTGFTHKESTSIRAQLEKIEQQTCPFDPRPAGHVGRNSHWVRPDLVAEVSFTEWTSDRKIRHPSFQGFRQDKRPSEVVVEKEAGAADVSAPPQKPRTAAHPKAPPKSKGQRTEVVGVSLSNPGRILYPDIGLTKLDLARYYEGVARWMLPHLTDRPLTLVRCPEGTAKECFYMKHSNVWAPEALRRVRIPEKKKTGDYLVVDSLQGLLSLVQMDVLEIHTWNSRAAQVEQPDRIVLDIDPGPEIAPGQVVDAARLIRRVLDKLGLESFVKTTGGAGLHVVVPLLPGPGWDDCLEFSRGVAEALVRSQPSLYTIRFSKAGRERKILVDYMRNNRTATSVATFSTRAREGAPVSVPLSWTELKPDVLGSHFTVATVLDRLRRLRRDPWQGYWNTRQRIEISMLDAVR